MSISNFSVSLNPDALFLNSLEDRVAELVAERMGQLRTLSASDRHAAQIGVMFEVEQFRTRQIQEYCKSKQLKSLEVESETAGVTLPSQKWRMRPVFTAKSKFNVTMPQGLFDRSNGKKKSLFVNSTNPIGNIATPRKRNSSYLNPISCGTSMFPVIGEKEVSIPMTFSRKNHDGARHNATKTILPKEEATEEDLGENDLYNDSASEGSDCNADDEGYGMDEVDSLLESVSSEDSHSEEEMQEEDHGSVIDCLVLSLLKQKSNAITFDSTDVYNIFWAFSRYAEKKKTEMPSDIAQNTMLHSKKFKFDLDSLSDKVVSLIIYNGRFVKLKSSRSSRGPFFLNRDATEHHISELPQSFGVFFGDVVKTCDSNSDAKTLLKKTSTVIGTSAESFRIAPVVIQKDFIVQKVTSSALAEEQFSQLNRKFLADGISLAYDHANHSSFSVSIESGNFGAYLNLSRSRFQQKMLLETGMLFLINERVGFYISEIVKGNETQKREKVVQDLATRSSFDAYCNNLGISQLPEFLAFLKASDNTLPEKTASVLYKEFCVNHLKNEHRSDFLVLSFVEYFPHYKVFKVLQDCLVFKYQTREVGLSAFFAPSLGCFGTLTFGQSLFHDLRLMAKSRLCSLTAFHSGYDITIDFNETVQRFCFHYPKLRTEAADFPYCSLFDESDAHVKFAIPENSFSSESLPQEEGLWVLLGKFDLFADSLGNSRSVKVPFGSLLMMNRNVYLIERRSFALRNK